MYQITARGPRTEIEAAWDLLAWTDPSPADAVDAKEDTRLTWRLDAYAQSRPDADACAELIRQNVPSLNPVVEALADRDWIKVSLEGLPAVEAGSFIVAGSHVLTQAAPGKTSILIEAGPAFGTGHHGTTLGCLKALEHIHRRSRPAKVLDVGAGSGVLAIAALKSGSRRALGTDIDIQSVDIAAENAAKNNTGRQFKSLHGRGAALSVIHNQAPYDLIFANILARPLTQLAPHLVPLLKPNGHIVLSGLLNHQEPLIRKAYNSRGLVLVKRFRQDGWSSLLFKRTNASQKRLASPLSDATQRT